MFCSIKPNLKIRRDYLIFYHSKLNAKCGAPWFARSTEVHDFQQVPTVKGVIENSK